MLIVNDRDSAVAARLLEFFDFRTPWHRRLWATGLLLTLRELIEASEMVAAKVLFQNSITALGGTAMVLAGTDAGVTSGDPGVGTADYKRKLHRLLQSQLVYRSIEYLELVQIADDIESRYLKSWSAAFDLAPVTANPLKAERSARAIGSHLLDLGFSAEFLYGWWRWKVSRDPEQYTLSQLVAEAHSLTRIPEKQYEILVIFREAPPNRQGSPPGWMSALEVIQWLGSNGLRQKGSDNLVACGYRCQRETLGAQFKLQRRPWTDSLHGFNSAHADSFWLFLMFTSRLTISPTHSGSAAEKSK